MVGDFALNVGSDIAEVFALLSKASSGASRLGENEHGLGVSVSHIPLVKVLQ